MAEYTIDKFTYDGNTYKLKSSTLKNLVDGSQEGSVRAISTTAESSTYTIGVHAFAEGNSTEASGQDSHAEGLYSKARGYRAHAEGYRTTASGDSAHTEGYNTTASGTNSHTEGDNTTASGADSHVEGYGTIANHAYQHVFGLYNVEDDSTATATNKGNYIEIVGNGAYSARANARTLDWSGNEVLAGKLTLGAAGVNSMDAATVGQIPNVPAWALASTKPTYTAVEVGAQPTLVSGTNIKTINNESILGSGDITIQSNSYTASSPITIDNNNNISHEASGVTAGTYVPSHPSKSYTYFPSITVDNTGHITSASNMGYSLESIGNTDATPKLITQIAYDYTVRSCFTNSTYSSYILTAGNTSKRVSIANIYGDDYYFKVDDVICRDKTTFEPIICDWKTTTFSGYDNHGSLWLDVSIAEPYTNDILIDPIISYGRSTGM